MKTKILLFALAIALAPWNLALADVSVSSATTSPETSFRIDLRDAALVKGIKGTKFNFDIKDIKGGDKIDYWKVRFYCNRKMTIEFKESGKNMCNKAVDIDDLDVGNTLSFMFKNNSFTSKNFSFKLKAYDSGKNWLYTDQEFFRWK